MYSIRMLAPAAVLLIGCSFHSMPFKATDVVSKTFPVSGTPTVIVETFNGHVDVTVGDDKTVSAEVTRQSGGSSQEAAQADLKNIEVSITNEGDTIHIIAKNSDEKLFSHRSAEVDVHVPVGSILNLKTSNGRIQSIGLAGDVQAHTSNGGIEVKGNRGNAKLQTSNGGVRVEGGRGKLELTTSNGSIHVNGDKPVTVAARTSNGSIHFAGTLAAGENSFKTSNGAIHLELPADAQFSIDASTSMGKITSEFTLAKTDESTKSRLKGATGDNPTTAIHASTSMGRVEINRKK